MKLGTPTRWLFTLASLSIESTVSAADVRVMISAGFYGVYSELSLVSVAKRRLLHWPRQNFNGINTHIPS
jgi:hypothetical protein